MIELKIGSYYIDLYKDVSFPLNFQATDAGDPGKIKTDFSYTLTIPASQNNNKAFNHLFEVAMVTQTPDGDQYNPDFNPAKRADAIAWKDTIEQFRGYAQLTKIVNNNDEVISYELNLFGDSGNFFADNKEKELASLDLSRFNHSYSKLNQANSWATSIKVNGGTYYFEYGIGYVYPMIDYGFGTDEKTFKVEWMFPAVYAYTIWEQIFSESGYSYTSDFIDGSSHAALFSHLILPFHSDAFKLTDAQVTERLFRATKTTLTEVLITEGAHSGGDTVVIFNNDSTAGNFDNGNNYSTLTGEYTCNKAGKWSFKVVLKMGLRFEPSVDNAVLNTDIFFYAKIWSDTGSGLSLLNTKLLYVAAYGTIVDIGEIRQSNIVFEVGETYTANPDKIYVEVEYSLSPNKTHYQSGVTGTIHMRIEEDSVFYNSVINDAYREGETVTLMQVLPDWTCAEFITQICKTFNLIMQPDRENSKRFIIEPFNDFYNGAIRYWSTKVDRSKNIESIPIPLAEAREMLYTYSQDKDYYNDIYSRDRERVFGDRTIEMNTDFGSEQKKMQLDFGATPMVGSKVSDRVIPKIYKIDDQGNISQKAVNPRLLYYGGMKATGQNWVHRSTTTGDTSYSSFPYAGTMDDMRDPLIDLNFGQPDRLYYSDAVITVHTLYNDYHKDYVDEIKDKDSRLVYLWVWLAPVDILTLSFRSLINIDGVLYRLNKITGYDPNGKDSTKIELLKVRKATGLIGAAETPQHEVIGGQGATFSGESVPVYAERVNNNDNYYNPRRGHRVTGSGNYVDDESQNVTIIGNNNRVMNGASDVVVIGDDRQVIATGTNPTTGWGNYYDISGYSSLAKLVLHSPENAAGRQCYAEIDRFKLLNSRSCIVVFKGIGNGSLGIQLKVTGPGLAIANDVILGYPETAQGTGETNPGSGLVDNFCFKLHITRDDTNFIQIINAQASVVETDAENSYDLVYSRNFDNSFDMTSDNLLIYLSCKPATYPDDLYVESIEVIYNP